MNASSEPGLAEAMNRLWERFLPQMKERVATLQQAAKSLADGNITQVDQQKAASDAHKLAGVLGTFGLKDGTDLAREAESLYESPVDQARAFAVRQAAIADQLQKMIASRK